VHPSTLRTRDDSQTPVPNPTSYARIIGTHTIVERHGGTVEKFIGDAVMAVFGVPQLHEDDALRAVRAAVEMRDALPELGVEARIGLNTGEVVVGTAERLATGDAVNVAARLEQAAAPGEILLGPETAQLVRDAVETEPTEPLELKGKREPLVAQRLLVLHEEAPAFARRLDAPLVGRARELRRLQEAFAQAVDDRSCQLFTILGVAGVGKSRLTAEFIGSLGDATVVRGRCLPYGEGITYWPVIEVLQQLPRASDLGLEPAAVAAIEQLLGEEHALSSSEEIPWAVRKLSRQPRSRLRSWRCSTTSTGPSRPSSSCSSTWPISRARRRSCSSAWPGPSCSTGAQAGAVAS
jgi:hypothetical protein